MKVNIALLTVTDTRTFDNDKSGAILVDKIKEANHSLLDRKICKDNKDEIVLILKEWLQNKKIDVIITSIFSFLSHPFNIKTISSLLSLHIFLSNKL